MQNPIITRLLNFPISKIRFVAKILSNTCIDLSIAGMPNGSLHSMYDQLQIIVHCSSNLPLKITCQDLAAGES
jgi:hypothetical protein